jgi:hypothetical protein
MRKIQIQYLLTKGKPKNSERSINQVLTQPRSAGRKGKSRQGKAQKSDENIVKSRFIRICG